MDAVVADKQSWEFADGHEIAPGRTVLKPLGGGNRCEVYLVWDERLFAVTVAKLLRRDLVADEGALRGLRREAEALAALAHPVILRGFGAHLDGPYPHVLVEHLEGPTLRRLIKRGGPLPAEQPRVIDLSLARTLERAMRLRDYIGSNAYMPPEQCVPNEDVGPPADVWGLGATLYHAAAGRRPFPKPHSRDDSDALELRFPQLTEEPRPWPVCVPESLAQAIYACLQKDPDDRPTARELALMLQPVGVSNHARGYAPASRRASSWSRIRGETRHSVA